MPTIADKSNIEIGTKVVRGRDWKWNNQDHHEGKPSIGEVIQYTYCFPDDSNAGWVKVEWESGSACEYRIGKYEDGKENFDLYLYEETPQLIKSEPTITITGKVTDIVPYPDVEIKVKPKKKKPTI